MSSRRSAPRSRPRSSCSQTRQAKHPTTPGNSAGPRDRPASHRRQAACPRPTVARRVDPRRCSSGVLTGLGVAAFESVVTGGSNGSTTSRSGSSRVAPFLGLVVAALALRWIGARATPSTADEYLLAFHDSEHALGLRALAARMVAGIATLASGAPMGLEGPSLYLGAAIGDTLERRVPRLFSARNRRLLLVAGAAAGVAAIFRAPATGAVFALEVPYQDNFARNMLAPALVGSASSYLVFVAIHGTAPVLAVTGSPPFSFKDLTAALVLGLLAGVGARDIRVTCFVPRNRSSARAPPWVRVPAAGLALAMCFVCARLLAGANLTTGPGYDTIRWALDPTRSTWLVAAILVLRVVATSTTVAGGGVGGLFIPLVVAGALAGRIVGGVANALDTSLFTVDRRGGVPRRRIPRTARSGRVRCRSNRSTGLHCARPARSRRR